MLFRFTLHSIDTINTPNPSSSPSDTIDSGWRKGEFHSRRVRGRVREHNSASGTRVATVTVVETVRRAWLGAVFVMSTLLGML